MKKAIASPPNFLSRRDFVRTTGLASAGVMLGSLGCKGASGAPIGLQLYTLRDDVAKDPRGTIARIAGVGYDTLELFGYSNGGYFGMKTPDFKALLDQHHLKSPSSHYVLPGYLFKNNEDELKQLIEVSKLVGNEFLTAAWIAEEDRPKTVDGYKQLAARFNAAGQACKAAGLRFAYHNHDFEFLKFEGTCGLEVLLNNTDPSLVNFEMDIYWVVFAGENPDQWIKNHPHRFAMWHVKDLAPQPEKHSVEAGKGTIDFKEIFTHQDESGMKYFFVEQEAYTDPPKQAIATSYRYIKDNLVKLVHA